MLTIFADKMYKIDLESKYILEDYKLKLSPSQLKDMIGEESFNDLETLFGQPYDEILIRRCQAHGQFIKFHTDVSKRTLQVALNGDDEYEGGRLVFATNGALIAPERPEGTVTIHHNDIAHGVSLLESGIRYGLFILQK